jgi:protein required for attachment to host cells
MRAKEGNMRIWIVVADEREALFYDAKGPHGPFDLALTITSSGRAPAREPQSDRAAWTAGGSGEPRYALDENDGAHRMAQFAKEVAAEIERGRTSRRFDRFVIMSAARMLGLIRGALTPESRAALAGEVVKELAHQGRHAFDRRPPERPHHRSHSW